ncbi:MAG: acyl-CoA dehydrogenase family protein [Actinomycetota bacterium]|nr:acyl-CoA dehydrogenase family protein [Actinomycetota bacterium]
MTTSTDTSTDLEAFRAEVRAWFKANGKRIDDHSAVEEADGETVDYLARARGFMNKLYDAGFSGLSWPKEYGGQSLTMNHQRVFNEEANGYDLQSSPFMVTLGMCAPTLLQYGTEEQREEHIPKMLRGDEVWCQLFSEPGAGSDVAGLTTKAVRDGDEWVINGQKVWTSGAHFSKFGLIVTRTNVDVPKHKGITMFIVDMSSPGVTVRPLRQMSGGSGFNEVFFDNVRVPASNLVGEVDHGWMAAIGTLMNERVSIGAGGGGLGRGSGTPQFDNLSELATHVGKKNDGATRQELASIYVEERLIQILGDRMRAGMKAGKAPGPEGSIAKLSGSELGKRSADMAMTLLAESGQAWTDGDEIAARWAGSLLGSPGGAIAGGTPEIMRNILGERSLGLPKEPQVDRDMPFKDVKTN